MIKIPNDIDKYISDYKMQIVFDREKKIMPVSFENVNSFPKRESINTISNKNTTSNGLFEEMLQQEIKKLL